MSSRRKHRRDFERKFEAVRAQQSAADEDEVEALRAAAEALRPATPSPIDMPRRREQR
jgi:hypothetical protein